MRRPDRRTRRSILRNAVILRSIWSPRQPAAGARTRYAPDVRPVNLARRHLFLAGLPSGYRNTYCMAPAGTPARPMVLAATGARRAGPRPMAGGARGTQRRVAHPRTTERVAIATGRLR